MYLRNPGPVREYLTPGVEVVSVDPDCVYNVDEDDEELLTDSEEEEDDSNVTDSSDEDFIIDVEGLGQRRTTPKRQAAAEPISAATSIATFCPAATSTALPTNQTCLENIYNDNFDLAAYITDNDFDFQTTVDHTDQIMHQIASTIDHCSTSQLLVSASTVDPGSMHAAPSTSHQSFGFGFGGGIPVASTAPTTVDAAGVCVDASDTYHYVEKWLESCLQDEKSTVDTINAVAGVMGISPLKLDRELVGAPAPVGFLDIKQNFCQSLFDEPVMAAKPTAPKKSPKQNLPPQRVAPIVGKGRGKNISMYSMFREDEAEKIDDSKTKCEVAVLPVATHNLRSETEKRCMKARNMVDDLAKPLAIARDDKRSVKPPSEHDSIIDVVVDSDDEDDESLVDAYNPSHSDASSSDSSVNVVSRPKRAVTLAKQVVPPPPIVPAKKPTLSKKVAVVQPSKRKFRSKSYISSSSSSSGSEANAKIDHQQVSKKLQHNANANGKQCNVVVPSKESAKPGKSVAVPEPATKNDIPKTTALGAKTKSFTSKAASSKIAKRANSMDSVALKRKNSIVSSDSNDPSGFLEDLLRSRKPIVKRDANRKTLMARNTYRAIPSATKVEKQISLLKKRPIAHRQPTTAVVTPAPTNAKSPLTNTTTKTVDIQIETSAVRLEGFTIPKVNTMNVTVNKLIPNELMETDDVFVSNEEEAVVVVDSKMLVEEENAQQKKRLNLEEYLKRRRVSKVNNCVTDKEKVSAKRDHLARMAAQQKAERAAQQEKAMLHNQNLVELVVVSMGCNTDITISNASNDDSAPSSHLINNINDTIIKAHSENVKISSNSLIASIQDVIIKKCIPTSTVDETMTVSRGATPPVEAAAAKPTEHGEDKVIMYLPKDRRKVLTKSIECQTENLLQFPMLQTTKRKRDRNYRQRTNSRHSYRSRSRSHRGGNDDSSDSDRRRSSSYDDDSDSSSYTSDASTTDRHRSFAGDRSSNGGYRSGTNGRYFAHGGGNGGGHQQSRSRINSYRQSLSRSESETTESEENLRLNSSHKHAHHQQHQHPYGSVQSIPMAKPSAEQNKIIEERRIVYVGRIETNTTKEDLKKKFVSYGPIRQVTFHYKDTGMKFGFVTFDNAKDAYRAIDCSTRDDTIKMYDVSFGGRRAFCKSTYLDLDGSQVHQQATYAPVTKPPPANDSFEELLRKMKEKLSQKRTAGDAATNS